jgi:predicted O-methyltransferase YrrM
MHMSESIWAHVDDYLENHLLPDDPVLASVLDANRLAGLPSIDVSPLQGRLLALLVRLTGARRILEVGTLGGYSTVCMARALPPGGQVVTLELEPHHAELAQRNFGAAGLAEVIELRVGSADRTLERMVADGAGPFDLVFIDADKPSNVIYLDAAVQLARPGTLIILDNVVRSGGVADGTSTDRNVMGSRAGIELLGSHPRLSATALQTVGSKGYDGFAMAIVD